MKYILHGYCGLFCGACPNLLNTTAGLGAESCYGCKSELPAGYCTTCGIKACALGKGYEFCNECADLGTCELMQKFMHDANWPYQQFVSNNFETIKSEGLTKWLEKQVQHWRCTNCGAPYSWFAETCPQCCRSIANYKADH